MSKVFPFKRDFDEELATEAEQGRVRVARAIGPSEEEFAQAIEAARQQSFEEGRAKGFAEGQATEQEKISAKLTHLNEGLVEQLVPLLQNQFATQQQLERESIGILSDIVQKLLPEILQTQGKDLVKREIEAAAMHAAGSPWLNVSVHPDLVDAIESNLAVILSQTNSTTVVKVTSDPNSEETDVKAYWESGRSNYSLKLLCEKIIDTISNAGNPTSMTVVENNNGQ